MLVAVICSSCQNFYSKIFEVKKCRSDCTEKNIDLSYFHFIIGSFRFFNVLDTEHLKKSERTPEVKQNACLFKKIFFITCNISNIFKFHYNNPISTFSILIQLCSYNSSCEHSTHRQVRFQVPQLVHPQNIQIPAACQIVIYRACLALLKKLLPQVEAETNSSFMGH